MRKYMSKNESNIINRKHFDEATISGRPVKNGYIIRSYSTPICLYSNETNTWYLTNERFTQTTSTQQSALRLIFHTNNTKLIYLSTSLFESQLKELSK